LIHLLLWSSQRLASFHTVYETDLLQDLLPVIETYKSKLCTLIIHGTVGLPEETKCSISVLSHVFKTATAPTEIDMTNALACPVPDNNYDPTGHKSQNYDYIHADQKIDIKDVKFAILPNFGEEIYDHGIANLAHSRSLSFLKPRIGGPWFDLEKVGSTLFDILILSCFTM
jgi:hypothetical protein